MAKAAGVHGARIDVSSAVREIIVERGRATLVSVVGLPVRTAVEAGFDAVAAMIEAPLHDRRAVMQALVDPITAPVEVLADA